MYLRLQYVYTTQLYLSTIYLKFLEYIENVILDNVVVL